MSVQHREPKPTSISVHVLPDNYNEERAIELLERYCQAIDAGQHPPFKYISAVFTEIDALLAQCEDGDS